MTIRLLAAILHIQTFWRCRKGGFLRQKRHGGANCPAVILSDTPHAFPLSFRAVFTFVRVAQTTAVFNYKPISACRLVCRCSKRGKLFHIPCGVNLSVVDLPRYFVRRVSRGKRTHCRLAAVARAIANCFPTRFITRLRCAL